MNRGPFAVAACAAVALAVATALGCGSSSPGSARPFDTSPAPSATTPVEDAGKVDAALPPPADAGPGTTTYTATVAASPTSSFGGSPFCTYAMTLEDIHVQIVVGPSGEVVGASVSDQAHESIVGSCPYMPAPPSTQTFGSTTSSKLPTGGVHIDFAEGAGNTPKASLVLETSPAAGSRGLPATLEWHRTDQGPPLDWKVQVSTTLSTQ